MTDFDHRFQNWIHWCNLKGFHQNKAGSLEGNYRSPQIWHEPEPKPEWLLTLDYVDAVELNRAFYGLPLEVRRIIIILWFRTHWRPTWQAQKLKCHHTKLQERAFFAKQAFHNHLTLTESKRRFIHRSRETVQAA